MIPLPRCNPYSFSWLSHWVGAWGGNCGSQLQLQLQVLTSVIGNGVPLITFFRSIPDTYSWPLALLSVFVAGTRQRLQQNGPTCHPGWIFLNIFLPFPSKNFSHLCKNGNWAQNPDRFILKNSLFFLYYFQSSDSLRLWTMPEFATQPLPPSDKQGSVYSYFFSIVISYTKRWKMGKTTLITCENRRSVKWSHSYE